MVRWIAKSIVVVPDLAALSKPRVMITLMGLEMLKLMSKPQIHHQSDSPSKHAIAKALGAAGHTFYDALNGLNGR
jgi:hypothetical protein